MFIPGPTSGRTITDLCLRISETTGSLVTTTIKPTVAADRSASIVSNAKARAREARRSLVKPASRVFARSACLTGTITTQDCPVEYGTSR